MFLDNYNKIRKQAGLTATDGTFITNLNTQITTTNGTAYTITHNECCGADRLIRVPTPSTIYTTIPSATSGVNYAYHYVVFGDGDTPVSTSDYSISGSRIADINISSVTGVATPTGYKIMYNFTYTGSSPTTIKEVCIYDNFGAYAYSNSRKVALWREVFDTPLELPAGSSFTYNFEVDLTTGG